MASLSCAQPWGDSSEGAWEHSPGSSHQGVLFCIPWQHAGPGGGGWGCPGLLHGEGPELLQRHPGSWAPVAGGPQPLQVSKAGQRVLIPLAPTERFCLQHRDPRWGLGTKPAPPRVNYLQPPLHPAPLKAKSTTLAPVFEAGSPAPGPVFS